MTSRKRILIAATVSLLLAVAVIVIPPIIRWKRHMDMRKGFEQAGIITREEYAEGLRISSEYSKEPNAVFSDNDFDKIISYLKQGSAKMGKNNTFHAMHTAWMVGMLTAAQWTPNQKDRAFPVVNALFSGPDTPHQTVKLLVLALAKHSKDAKYVSAALPCLQDTNQEVRKATKQYLEAVGHTF